MKMIPIKHTFTIKDFDIYSKNIGLFFNNKNSLSSYFGLTLTFFYCILFIILFVYYTVETINKTNLKVYNSIRYPTETPSITLNNDLFYLAFGAEDPKNTSVYIDETIYYPKVIYFYSIKENDDWRTIEKKYLEIEKCNISKFSKRHRLLFKNNTLSTNYCIKDFNNLKLIGSYSYNELAFIQIILYPCKNTTENNNHCKPQNIIDNFLTASYISVQLEDIGLTPTDYNNPTIPIIQDLYTSIGKSFYKEMLIFYKIVEIENDIGLFYKNTETKKFIKFDREFDTMHMLNESEYYNGGALCTVNIRLSDTIEVNNRIYGKMSEVFTTTGGYMQFLNLFFSLLSFIFNNYNMKSTLIDNLFNYNSHKNKLILKHNIEKLNKYEEYKNNILIPTAYFKKKSQNNLKLNKKINPTQTEKRKEINNDVNNIKRNDKPRDSKTEIKFNPSSIPKSEHFDINAINFNNVNKMVFTEKIIGNSSIYALNKNNNLENILCLNKNINNIDLRRNVFKKNQKIHAININVNSFKFNILEYYFYKSCKRVYYKKQFVLYEYGLEVIKNQLDIINIFNAIFCFNNLLKRVRNIDSDDSFINI